MFKYDYLIVGSGLFGATFAYRAKQAGKRCLVIDKRAQLGGNVYCDSIEGIHVHTYGAHIFHTSNKDVWDFVNSLVPFNRYTNCPVANYKGTLYNLPFNMNTFYQMWGTRTPKEAQEKINRQRAAISSALNGSQPQNLEEQALLLVGKDIYEKLIKGYTEKQWGRLCTELPAFIIRRLPLRFVYDNNYFNDPYQGIPTEGYNALIEKLLEGIDTKVNYDFLAHREELKSLAEKIVYTGPIDQFYDYQFGKLEYRTVRSRRTIRAMRLLTTRTARHPTRASSNISILSRSVRLFTKTPKRSSAVNIAWNGNRGWSLIIPSTTTAMQHCINNTNRLQKRRRKFFSEVGLRNINTTTWRRQLSRR